MRHDYRMSEIDMTGGMPVLRGRSFYNEPMKKYVSWRAGGAAQRVYVPADLEDLIWLIRSIPAREDIHMVGLGSNLLVRDGGVAGVVILLHGVLKKLAIESRTHGFPPHRWNSTRRWCTPRRAWRPPSWRALPPITIWSAASSGRASTAPSAARWP